MFGVDKSKNDEFLQHQQKNCEIIETTIQKNFDEKCCDMKPFATMQQILEVAFDSDVRHPFLSCAKFESGSNSCESSSNGDESDH